MIKVTRLNGQEIVINAELIEYLEASPDTIIALTTGKKIMVKESVDEVVERIIEYRKRCLGGSSLPPVHKSEDET
ncbi:flagellar protein FlbD [Candidatus Kryptonium thompsonii]|uniref:Flagellar protein FlbD n=1 Tax=Candidatus Kryptonium thompsonii TaxID=1633631 RepID=A0A0N7MNU5_9BACT|nr:flagellar FlbD family protein [Candidatus Kryptonium thompsoni]CUS76776.1 flagellar protein FlbD [Candidatus Kryptonium thompsoni]CUS77219.1 flagellar protein FlbD [Candidatus Kryptonium thompsoni]CUS79097.1 flagellar protein FlbD [Candidatus Kryptonium thompsoni]CUS89667.1 flagellar protein FlbD [Candidatus Kryptonium thompsoni]CUS92910.1 flagellar protein FlbD [Candidatus Kryptonium thompsoni]